MNVSKGNINVMILMLYQAPVSEYHPHLMKSYIPRDDPPGSDRDRGYPVGSQSGHFPDIT
jgi:hypothetical protein